MNQPLPTIWFNPELHKSIVDIIMRAANISCCLCRDDCLACDAMDVLRNMGIDFEKKTYIPENAIDLVLEKKDGS